MYNIKIKNISYEGSITVLVLLVLFFIFTMLYNSSKFVSSNMYEIESMVDNNINYYNCSSQANKFLYDLEIMTNISEVKAIEYIESKGYLYENYYTIPDIFQQKFLLDYTSAVDKTAELNKIMNSVYMYYLNAYLEYAINNYENLKIYTHTDDALINSITVSLLLTSGDTNLNLTVEIPKINNSVHIEDGNTNYTKSDTCNYTIKEYNIIVND